MAPVWFPRSSTTFSLTSTYSTPTGYWWGLLKVALSLINSGSKRNKSAHLKEKAALHRKKAAKAREMSLIYQEEAEQLEKQAQDLERTLKPIYPKDRGGGYRDDDRGGGYRDDDRGGYDRYRRDEEW